MTTLHCVWEHNGGDTLLYAADAEFFGVYARGTSREEALQKISRDAAAYCRWRDVPVPGGFTVEVVQEQESTLQICDADSDVLFDTERPPLTFAEYAALRDRTLRSARDFLALYRAVPDAERSVLPARKTFYGAVPRTAEEMYVHTKNVNAYYFGEIGVEAGNDGDILSCRAKASHGWSGRRGIWRIQSSPGAGARTGRCESCCGGSSGMTGFMQRPCTAWRCARLTPALCRMYFGLRTD